MRWEYILSYEWPCLQLKVEFITMRNKQIMREGESNEQSPPENTCQCELTEAVQTGAGVCWATVWEMELQDELVVKCTRT